MHVRTTELAQHLRVHELRCCVQVLYGIILQHFAILAGQDPTPSPHLDALIAPLAQMTAEVPMFAAAAARARLSRMQQALNAALQDTGCATMCLARPA